MFLSLVIFSLGVVACPSSVGSSRSMRPPLRFRLPIHAWKINRFQTNLWDFGNRFSLRVLNKIENEPLEVDLVWDSQSSICWVVATFAGIRIILVGKDDDRNLWETIGI